MTSDPSSSKTIVNAASSSGAEHAINESAAVKAHRLRRRLVQRDQAEETARRSNSDSHRFIAPGTTRLHSPSSTFGEIAMLYADRP